MGEAEGDKDGYDHNAHYYPCASLTVRRRLVWPGALVLTEGSELLVSKGVGFGRRPILSTGRHVQATTRCSNKPPVLIVLRGRRDRRSGGRADPDAPLSTSFFPPPVNLRSQP